MPDEIRRASPLSDSPPAMFPSTHAHAHILFSERKFCGHVNLRGDSSDPAFLGGAQRCLGASLPLQTNQVSATSQVTVLCLGPDEWLLVTAPSGEGILMEALRALDFAATNLTDGNTILRLQGPRVVDVLRKGCSLNLHPRAFKPGTCAQTLIAKAGVLIHYVDESPTFDLIVRRSFAEYLALWLEDAATEFG